MKDLFDNYSKEVRPVKNKNAAIEVEFGIAYTQLVELVSCQMAMHINASLLLRLVYLIQTIEDGAIFAQNSVSISRFDLSCHNLFADWLFRVTSPSVSKGAMEQFYSVMITGDEGAQFQNPVGGIFDNNFVNIFRFSSRAEGEDFGNENVIKDLVCIHKRRHKKL